MNSFDINRCLFYISRPCRKYDKFSDIDYIIECNKIHVMIPYVDWNHKEYIDDLFSDLSYKINIEDLKIKNYFGSIKFSIFLSYSCYTYNYIIEIFIESISIQLLSVKKYNLISLLLEKFGKKYIWTNEKEKNMMNNTKNQKITLFQILIQKLFI